MRGTLQGTRHDSTQGKYQVSMQCSRAKVAAKRKKSMELNK